MSAIIQEQANTAIVPVRPQTSLQSWASAPIFGADMTGDDAIGGLIVNVSTGAILTGVFTLLGGAVPLIIGAASTGLCALHDYHYQRKLANSGGGTHPEAPTEPEYTPQPYTHVGVDTKLNAIPVQEVETTTLDTWEDWPLEELHQVQEEQHLAKQIVIPEPKEVIAPLKQEGIEQVQARSFVSALLNEGNPPQPIHYKNEWKICWEPVRLAEEFKPMTAEQWTRAFKKIAIALPESYTWDYIDAEKSRQALVKL